MAQISRNCNLITCMNVISGTLAIFLAMYGLLTAAAILILVGMVFDFFDGMTARLLHVKSEIGKELDSLADMVSFGFSISADSLTQAVMILFSCLLFRGIIGKRSQRGAVALAVTSVLLAMCKFVYMPLVLLVIPLMFDRVSGRWRVNRGRAVPLLIGVVASGIWTIFWLGVNAWYTNCPMLVSYKQMSERKHALLTDPVAMLDAVKNIAWAITHAQSNMNNRTDSIMIAACWLAIVVSVVVLAVTSVVNACVKSRRKNPVRTANGSINACGMLSLPYAWLIAVVCIGDILLIYLALWLQYDADGLIGVDGMQFRYFLPYAPLFAFVMLESGRRLLKQ